MNWKPVELHDEYWIIQDEDGYTEYVDEMGDNLMFTSEADTLEKIKEINEKRVINKYKVVICRVENTIYEYSVLGGDEEEAKNNAWKLYNSGYEADYEDVVHAEEFTHEIVELENDMEVL